jgi:hypothetical protein
VLGFYKEANRSGQPRGSFDEAIALQCLDHIVNRGRGNAEVALQVRLCGSLLRKHLESLSSKLDLKTQPIGPRPKGKSNSRNAPAFDLRTELYRITGIDWTQINGIGVLTAQTVIAEAGADLSAFPSEKQFASWLGLCPTNEQSGGKILNRRTRKVVNRATVALRNAAMTLEVDWRMCSGGPPDGMVKNQ